jgi:hypothetical protein
LFQLLHDDLRTSLLYSITYLIPPNGAELSSAPMMKLFNGRFPCPISNLELPHPRLLLQ